MSQVVIDVPDLSGTDRLGRRLGACLQIGHVVGLIGPLGSGKTTLVKSVAAGAGVAQPRQVNSPTFVIVNEYDAIRRAGTLRLYHVDAYRLAGSADLEALGFDEMCTQGAVLVEWADRVPRVLPFDRLTIQIEVIDDRRRRFRCAAGGPTSRDLIARLQTDH